MLDWYISKNKVEYSLPLPSITKEEEEVVETVSEEFKELSKKEEIIGREEAEGLLEQILLNHCRREMIKIDRYQKRYLREYCVLNVLGFCGIDLLLKDEGIEEVGLIGIEKPVFVFKGGVGWLGTNLFFRNGEGIVDIINKMARSLGRRVTYQNPKLNAILPDGSRLHASIPPISDIELTIRKFRSKPLTIGDLINLKTYSPDALSFLSLVFQSDFNVIIAGNTASGKTSALNALFSYIPVNDRILIIEETPEISIPHPHKVKMVANAELGIGMRDLVEDSLRMRPDRVIVGEVRTPQEISALIETILSGQARGSYATFHAQSADETIKRLVSLGVLPADVASIDFVIVQRRMMRYDARTKRCWEERRGVEVVEIIGTEPKVNTLFKYDVKRDILKEHLGKSTKFEQIADSFKMSVRELSKELRKRKIFLKNIARKRLEFGESVKKIQSEFFGV